jgi:hypothetical protein
VVAIQKFTGPINMYLFWPNHKYNSAMGIAKLFFEFDSDFKTEVLFD